MLKIEIVPQASAATRLLRSPSGRYLLAELHGEWARETFGEHAGEVPPMLKLLESATGKVVAIVNGWPLGAPTDDGDVLYLEEHDVEYGYRVRSLARPDLILLAPPAGLWLVKVGLRVRQPGGRWWSCGRPCPASRGASRAPGASGCGSHRSTRAACRSQPRPPWR